MTTMDTSKPQLFIAAEPAEELPSSAKRGKRFKIRLSLELNEEAMDIVRGDFNPSRSPNVAYAKALAAALITMAQDSQDRPLLPVSDGGAQHVANERLNHALVRAIREAALAITHFETGAMFLVKAATS
jgi:hypothetical protein